MPQYLSNIFEISGMGDNVKLENITDSRENRGNTKSMWNS